MDFGAMKKIADFGVQAECRSMPQGVIVHAQNAILDSIGVSVAGVVKPAAKILTEHVRQKKVL
jgi:2-methylcitrate dehydratase PrpD